MTRPLAIFAVLALLCAPAWGAIAYVDKAYNENTSGTTLTVSVPAHSADDTILVWTESDRYGKTHTFSGGSLSWTAETAIGYNLFSDFGCTGRLHWATGDSGSASGFTGTFTTSTAAPQIVIVMIVSGADTTDPTGVSNTATRASDTTPAISQTTGVTANSWALAAYCTFSSVGPNESGTPSNMTLLHARVLSGSTSAGAAYDTTGTSSETYEWTGFAGGANSAHAVYEILEGAAASTRRVIVFD